MPVDWRRFPHMHLRCTSEPSPQALAAPMLAAGMADGKAWFKVPSALKFVLKGKPAQWISGKDIILHIIGMIGVDGALYKSMEFVGDGISVSYPWTTALPSANMAIEAGGKNGIFPVDEKAIEYIEGHTSEAKKAEYEKTVAAL